MPDFLRQVPAIGIGDQFLADAKIFCEIRMFFADEKSTRSRHFERARLDLAIAPRQTAGSCNPESAKFSVILDDR